MLKRQGPEYLWQFIRQVLGDQAGAEAAGRFDMQPGASFGCLLRRKTTGEEPGDKACQNVS